MRVAVIGANGLAGSAICQIFICSGHHVVAVARSPGKLLSLPYSGVHQISDLAHPQDWTSAFLGVDVVIHCAATVHLNCTEASSAAAPNNVQATRNIASAALDAGVKRLIYLSSIKVNGELTRSVPFATTHTNPQSEYAVAKVNSEVELLSYVGSPLEICILRPPLMYGPRLKGNLLDIFRAVDLGIPLPFGAIANRRDLLSVYNLSSLVLVTAEHFAAAGGVFLARDGAPISTPDIVRAVAKQLGRPARLIDIPVSLLRFGAMLVGKQEAAEKVIGSLEINDERTRALLGWRPTETFEDGLKKTAVWFRTQPKG